jgi:hypothetical protein
MKASGGLEKGLWFGAIWCDLDGIRGDLVVSNMFRTQ